MLRAVLLFTSLTLPLMAQTPTAPLPGEPKGTIVIRPRTTTTLEPGKVAVYPDKPGFIVIRPSGSVGSTLIGSSPKPTVTPGVTAVSPTTGPLAAMPIQAAKPEEPTDPMEGKIVHEVWYAIFLRNMKAGYSHVVVREYVRDGKTFRYAVKSQKLNVARFGQPTEIWGEDTSLETGGGQVLTARMRQGLGKNQMLSLEGKVIEGNKMQVKIEGLSQGEETIPYPETVLGISREAMLFLDKKPKVGDKIEYSTWEGRVNSVVKFQATVQNLEDLVIYSSQPARKVLKTEVKMDPIKGYSLPAGTMYLDATTFETLRLDSDDPVLGGKVTMLRTTKEFAQRQPGKLPELNEVQSIVLPQSIPNIHSQKAVTYNFAFKAGYDPMKTMPQDARQTLEETPLKTPPQYTLRVQAVRTPGIGKEEPATAEHLDASFFIDWKTDETRNLAQRASANLPTTASSWQKAQAVEAWVHKNMKAAEYSQAMAPCTATAKSLTGDCTEYAMLAAGMCRALGVPSRTAMGVIYAPDAKGQPTLAYHMWFEVNIDNRWLALDATLGQGSIGPGHIKITDHSWHEEKSLAPLLPVMGFLGSEPKVVAISPMK
ncbi:MAG: transglutaminase-like domain-containing protein [Fimbriiglobus sp.]